LKKNKTKIIGLLLIIIVVVVFAYLWIRNKNLIQSTNQDQTTSENDASLPETDSDDKGKDVTNYSADQNQTSTSSAQDTLLKFLNIVVSQADKSSAQDYSTDSFFKSVFVSSLVDKTASPPSFYQIISTNSKTDTTWSFQVKEEYNIDYENNAGANGAYIYSLIKEGDKWLVNDRE